MSSLRQRFNARITEPKQVAFIQEEISRREEELPPLEEKLFAERKRLKSCEKAVKTLFIKVDFAKRRLASQESYVTDLLGLGTQLDEAEGTLDETEPISGEIARHQAEIKTLLEIKQMIRELHAKRRVHDASRATLDALESHKKRILGVLSELKAAFSSIHIVPAEVWASIFRFCLEEDVQCYLKDSGGSKIHHTPLTLAQVCSFWREVVHTEKDLWRYFIYSLRRISDPTQVEKWKSFISFNSGSPTLLTSLDEVAPSASSLVLAPSPTSVHVVSRGSNYSMPAHHPFNQATSLTLEMDCSPSLQLISGVTSAFPKAKSITIVCLAHLPRLFTIIHSRRDPEITTLKMNLTTFDSFGIEYYSNASSTEEIHVLHNGVNYLIRNSGFQYEKLRVLGITPPDNVWIESLQFPLLRHLILYGPKTRTLVSPDLAALSQHPDFPRIRELGLLNWPTYTPPNSASWGIMPLILAIADQLRLVETIHCTNSFIQGESLVTLIALLTDTTTIQSPYKLKTVIIDCCSGITRGDCELIAASVEKLIVYV